MAKVLDLLQLTVGTIVPLGTLVDNAIAWGAEYLGAYRCGECGSFLITTTRQIECPVCEERALELLAESYNESYNAPARAPLQRCPKCGILYGPSRENCGECVGCGMIPEPERRIRQC